MGPSPRARAVTLFMVHQTTMHLFTTAGLNVALPAVMDEFNVDVATVVWVQLAYGLGLAGGAFPLGLVTTLVDRRRLVIAGALADVLLQVVMFATPSIYLLIAARFLQALVRTFPWLILQVMGVGGFPPGQRGKILGITSLAQGMATMLSVPLTGYVTEQWSWRWMFLAPAVIYAVFAVVVSLAWPKDERPLPRPQVSVSGFDLPGSGLMLGGMISALIALQTVIRGFESTLGIALGALGLAALALFVWVELHANTPILVFAVFKAPGVFLGATQAIFIGLLYGALALLLPFLFVKGYGWSVAYAASVLFFLNVARPAAGPLAGWLSDRYGSSRVVLPAAAIAIGGQLVAAFMGFDPPVELVITTVLLMGLSQSLMGTANLRQIYSSLSGGQLHLAPSTNVVLMQVGITSGQALAAAALAVRPVSSTVEALGDPALVAAASRAILVTTVAFAAGMAMTQILARILPAALHEDRLPREEPVGLAPGP